MITIEFYKENGLFCAIIGSETSSGIKVNGTSSKELIKNLNEYLLNIAEEEFDNTEKEE